jgi:hypothetical protein
MIRKRRAGMSAIVLGLVIAAVASANAAAAVPVFWLSVHARLAPISGTTAAGRFSGSLVVRVGDKNVVEPWDPPPFANRALLTWKLKLPALGGPMTASLRLRATKTAAPVARTLCTGCSTAAGGQITLTASQGLRIAQSGAVVVVRTASATLRGSVKAVVRTPNQPTG